MSATSTETVATALPKLGIIAGSGDLPARIISACMQSGREMFVLSFEGESNLEIPDSVPFDRVRLGAIGQAISLLQQNGAQDLVLAGRVTRPSLSNLRPDWGATKLLAKLGPSLLTGGDDALFSAIVSFLESEGFRVIGADELLSELITPEGPIGKTIPNDSAQYDIALGAKAARTIGALDIGQAVIVQNGQVLGVEAAEGTDQLIVRCGLLKQDGMGGVLVKTKKPSQERRVDLPTIGVQTVENVHAAGFSGIAVEAGHSLIIDRKLVADRADELGLFLIGFSIHDDSHD